MKESRKEINIQKKVGFQDKEIRMEVSHREKMGLIKEIRVKNPFGKKVGIQVKETSMVRSSQFGVRSLQFGGCVSTGPFRCDICYRR